MFREVKHWLHMADYVAFRLCGVPATDPSLASRTLAYDLRRARWSEELLDGVGVPPATFPPIHQSGSPLGTLTPAATAETDLPAHTSAARLPSAGLSRECSLTASAPPNR